MSCDPATSGFSTTNDYIPGPGGEQMTEMTMNGSGSTLVWEHTNVWASSFQEKPRSSRPTPRTTPARKPQAA